MLLATWIYVSTSCIDAAATNAELDKIVSVSRIRNASMSVTGALLFSGERFAQCIEGPEAAICALRADIMGDRRHREIHTLTEGAIHSRYFDAWSLAYAGPATFVSRQLECSLQDARTGSSQAGANIRLLLHQFAESV